jgi:hypothetical protein
MFTLVRRPLNPSRRISDDTITQVQDQDGPEAEIVETIERVEEETQIEGEEGAEGIFTEKRERLYLTGPPVPQVEQYVRPYVRVSNAVQRNLPDFAFRAFKSMVLIAKIASLIGVCELGETMRRPLAYGLVVLALVDALIPDLMSSALLSGIHLIALSYFCAKGQCCI